MSDTPSMPVSGLHGGSEARGDHRHHLSRRLGVASVAFTVIVLGVVFWRNVIENPNQIVTEDAYLENDLTPISARISGYILDVPVEDYQTVKAGEVLVQLVDDDYRAQVAKADADLAAARSALDILHAQQGLLDANVAAADATVIADEATLEKDREESARQHNLIRDGVGSEQLLEQADARARQSTAELTRARALAAAARSQLAILGAQEQQAAAVQLSQAAALRLAQIDLSYTRITAPIDGVVGQRQVLPGEFLGIGGQVFTIAPPKLWVIANFKETQLTNAAVGQPATIVVDAFPDRTIKGHVEAFAPASGAKFALLPPDNATGNFTKVAQRISVKIALDDLDGLEGRLRAGMSVTTTISTGAGHGGANGNPE